MFAAFVLALILNVYFAPSGARTVVPPGATSISLLRSENLVVARCYKHFAPPEHGQCILDLTHYYYFRAFCRNSRNSFGSRVSPGNVAIGFPSESNAA